VANLENKFSKIIGSLINLIRLKFEAKNTGKFYLLFEMKSIKICSIRDDKLILFLAQYFFALANIFSSMLKVNFFFINFFVW